MTKDIKRQQREAKKKLKKIREKDKKKDFKKQSAIDKIIKGSGKNINESNIINNIGNSKYKITTKGKQMLEKMGWKGQGKKKLL
jgi:hypothetical protein